MRAEPHRIDFLLALPVDPRLDHVFGEDVSLEEEFVILFEGAQGFFERAVLAEDARCRLLSDTPCARNAVGGIASEGDEAVKVYRNAPQDKDLASLLCLFGSGEMIMPRWKRQGDTAVGLDEKGTPLKQAPLNEPVHIRAAYDKLYQIQRTNCP